MLYWKNAVDLPTEILNIILVLYHLGALSCLKKHTAISSVESCGWYLYTKDDWWQYRESIPSVGLIPIWTGMDSRRLARSIDRLWTEQADHNAEYQWGRISSSWSMKTTSYRNSALSLTSLISVKNSLRNLVFGLTRFLFPSDRVQLKAISVWFLKYGHDFLSMAEQRVGYHKVFTEPTLRMPNLKICIQYPLGQPQRPTAVQWQYSVSYWLTGASSDII